MGFIEDYSGVLEDQYRGSLHGHFIAYVRNAPVIDEDPDGAVVEFVDRYVSCCRKLPNLPGITFSEEDKASASTTSQAQRQLFQG